MDVDLVMEMESDGETEKNTSVLFAICLYISFPEEFSLLSPVL